MDLAEQTERMQTYYGMKHDPFGVLIDTMVFSGAGGRYETAETIRHLLAYSPQDNVITGSTGTGKRALASQVIKMLEPQWRIAWIDGSMIQTSSDLFQELIGQLGLGLKISDIESQEVVAVASTIADRAAEDELFLLVVQYAEQLPAFLLEMLTQIRAEAASSDTRLRQVWLVDDEQPLKAWVSEDDWYIYRLNPLTEEAAYQYLKDRFIAAGYVDTFPIDSKDVARLNELAKGIPKELNEIARDYLISSTFKSTEKKTAFPITHIAAGVAALTLVVIAVLYQTNDSNKKETVVLQASSETQPELSAVEQKLAEAVARVEAKQDVVDSEPVTTDSPLPVLAQSPEVNTHDEPKEIPVVPDTITVASLPEKTAPQQALMQSAADNEYTLQLIGVRDREKLDAILGRFASEAPVEVVQTVYKNAPWYVLIYGHFPDKSTAQKGVVEIPKSLGISDPWARTFSSLRNSQ